MALFAVYAILQAEGGFLPHLWRSLNPILLMPVVALVVGFMVRRARQINPGALVPQSAPLNGITPAESGLLLNGHIGPREVAATLVDLAVRKYLRIERVTPHMDGTLMEHDLVFHSLKAEGDWQDLEPHERTLLHQSFQSANWARFPQLKLNRPEIVPAMDAQIENTLWKKGIYRIDPNHRDVPVLNATLYIINAIALIDMLVLRLMPADQIYIAPELFFMALAITSAIVIWAARAPKFSTAKGTETWAHLLGLRQFIEVVDADRLQRLERYRFDQLLPYAMVFGGEQKWARAFRELAVHHFEWVGSDETDSLLRGDRLTFLSASLKASR
jgi:hypothetical protein